MSFITTINDTGMLVKQSKISNNDFALLNYFASIGSDHQTVVESTSNWYWLCDLLKDHQIHFALAHAKYLKAISYAKVKTDKVDSHPLAQLLRLNLIPAAHQISPEKRGLRDMMCARLRLVYKKTSCLNSIHHLLEKFNISVPNNRNSHDLSTLDYLNDLPLPTEYPFSQKALSGQIRLLHRKSSNWKKTYIQSLSQIPIFSAFYTFREAVQYNFYYLS